VDLKANNLLKDQAREAHLVKLKEALLLREEVPVANHKDHQARVKSHLEDLLKVDNLRDHHHRMDRHREASNPHPRVHQLKWALHLRADKVHLLRGGHLKEARLKVQPVVLCPHRANLPLRADKVHLLREVHLKEGQLKAHPVVLCPHRANLPLRADKVHLLRGVHLKEGQLKAHPAVLCPHRANLPLRADKVHLLREVHQHLARQLKNLQLKEAQLRDPHHKAPVQDNLNHQVEVRVDQSHHPALPQAAPVEE